MTPAEIETGRQSDTDLIDKVLAQLPTVEPAAPTRSVVEKQVLRSTGTTDAEAEPAMNRILLNGPSPPKDSPQARFKEAILGIRGRATNKEELPSRSNGTQLPPLPKEPQPPLPKAAPTPIKTRPSPFMLPTAPHGATVSGVQGGTTGYGRLSPVPFMTGTAQHVPNRGPAANQTLAASYTGHPLGIYSNSTGEITFEHPGYNHLGPAGYALPPMGYRYQHGNPAAEDYQGGYYRHSTPNIASRNSESSSGSSPIVPAPTQLLSHECQLRRFNPQWEEKEVAPGVFSCSVKLKNLLIKGSRNHSSTYLAKQAAAKKALKIVREMPLDSVIPAGISKVMSRVKEDRATQRGPRAETPVSVVKIDVKHDKDVKLEKAAEISAGPKSLVDRIEEMIGEDIPSDIKTNPVAARAYLAGFSVGSRCAELAAQGDRPAVPGQPQGSATRMPSTTRSRSRSPPRSFSTRSSPLPGYRQRSPPRDRSNRDRPDRYRPASCILPSSDYFRPHQHEHLFSG